MKKGTSISVRRLSKSFGNQEVLHKVDLNIASGELLTLLGPSGSGKTTLLNIIAGFLRPSSGRLEFGDRSVIGLAAHKRGVGMVFQSHALFPHLNVASNVGYSLKIRGVNRAERDRRVAQALELVQLSGFAERRVTELSGGQSQRVALARAIVFEPEVLLMDEPLSALDKLLREQMQIELRGLHEKLGMTTVHVTHDQREALTLADRIAVMNDGHIEQVGAPSQIYDRPETTFVAGFIGESTLLPVERSGTDLSLFGTTLHVAQHPPASRALKLVLRPERVRAVPEGVGHGEANAIAGSVCKVIYQGDSLLVILDTQAGIQIGVRQSVSQSPPRVGERINIVFSPEDAIIVADAVP